MATNLPVTMPTANDPGGAVPAGLASITPTTNTVTPGTVTPGTVTPTTTATPAANAPDPAAVIPPTAAPSTIDTSGNLFQGSALPATITTTQNQQTVPDFYTNYLQDIANLGQNAVTQGGVAGFGPLQQQAFQMAPQAAFSGAQTAGQGANLLQQAGTTSAANVVNQYLNPYTTNVVNEMARLQQQNLQRSVLPALAAAGVSSGGFGSKRQLSATGQTLADMQANLTGQQYNALNTGYQNAMTQAQADLQRQLLAGQGLGTISQDQYNIGQGGINQLSTLGQQQQALGQAMLNYPMTQAQNYAKLMQGYQIPTGSTSQVTAPGQQGQYTNSPLSQIAGLGALLASLFPTTNPAQTAQANYYNAAANNLIGQTPAVTAPTTATPTAADFYNATLAANRVGFTNYNPATGFYTNPTTNVTAKWDPATGQLVGANKDGGSIRRYALGGSVDPSISSLTSQLMPDPNANSYLGVPTAADNGLFYDPSALPMPYDLGPVPSPMPIDPTTITDPTISYPTAFDPNSLPQIPNDPNTGLPLVMYNMAGPTSAPTLGNTPNSPMMPTATPSNAPSSPRGGLGGDSTIERGNNPYGNQNPNNNSLVPKDQSFEDIIPRNTYDNAHVQNNVAHLDDNDDRRGYIDQQTNAQKNWHNRLQNNQASPLGQMGINRRPNQGNSVPNRHTQLNERMNYGR